MLPAERIAAVALVLAAKDAAFALECCAYLGGEEATLVPYCKRLRARVEDMESILDD